MGWHGLVRDVLVHYRSLRRSHEIAALSNYDFGNRSFVFDRRRGWESALLTGGQLSSKLTAGLSKNLFEDFR